MSTMLKGSQTAAVNFRLNSTRWDGIPKPNFLYYVRFVRSNANESQYTTDWAKSIGVLAKSIERPNVDFEVEVLNQYNKKRVIQKHQSFSPIQFTFHDTVDQRAANLFFDYYKFYYGDGRNSSFNAWSWDIMSNNFNQGAAGWGFIPPTGVTDFSYFFSHIELYYMYGGKYTQYDIINPKMSSMKTSSMAYSEGNGQAEISMTFVYEGLVYRGSGFDLSQNGGLLQEMGLANSGFYEPITASGYASVGTNYQTYGRVGAEPDYNNTLLTGINTASADAVVSSNTNINTLNTSNLNQNSIFNGSVFIGNDPSTTTETGSPVILDNIAKRLVTWMK